MNVEATLVTFRFTDDKHEALESITINLKDLFAEYGYIPRTKAIPIEWIKKWISERNDFPTMPYNQHIWNMLEDWERENGNI